MTARRLALVGLLGFGGGGAFVAAQPSVVFVEGARPRAALVLPAEPAPLEQRAADELREHLRLMTGLELPLATVGQAPANLLPIYLGAAADPSLDALGLAAGNNPSTFTLRVRNDRIDIRGLSDEGTLFGVYELLEQLGFRWYMPGELGRVVPDGDTASLRLQAETQAPSMDLRLLQALSGEWLQRVRLGGAHRATGSHGFPGHPPLGSEGGQICVSGGFAPGALAAVTGAIRQQYAPTDQLFHIGMGPEDSGPYRYCQCAGCRTLDRGVHDPFWNAESMTDRYVWFFNQILEELKTDYPNLRIAWYVYQRHMMPPKIQPNPRIVPVFAPITLDRMRGMDNPMSPDRHILRWLVGAWSATRPHEMFFRGYLNNLACVQLPKTQLDRVRNEIPALHEQGIRVMRLECLRQSFASDPLTLYVAARVMWNVKTDVDALLGEFYGKFYGPAAEPMRRYHEGLEAAFRDTPFITGSSYVYFPVFLGQPRRDTLRTSLDEAVALAAAGTTYAERLRVVRQGYERLDLFLDMIDARNHHDFATAHAKMEAFDRLTDYLVDGVLEGKGRFACRLVFLDESKDRGKTSYFNRFFRQAVVTGHERTVAKGEIVAALPDEWDFLLDPAEIGDMGGWHRPGPLGGNWQRMKTSTRSWSDQGLHNYKGVAWYRSEVEIAAKHKGRPLYLWFGGVDAIAHVWINGRFVGTSLAPEDGLPGAPGSFRPFDMPATGAVAYGATNWVTVKIENRTLSEVGTGGIVAPVMFWTPRDPAWRP